MKNVDNKNVLLFSYFRMKLVFRKIQIGNSYDYKLTLKSDFDTFKSASFRKKIFNYRTSLNTFWGH